MHNTIYPPCPSLTHTYRAFRDHFVIIAVPMLNPDGVFNGHFRQDTMGQNLNRHYQSPSRRFQPGVFAVKSLLTRIARAGKLVFYMDLHAHANKRGVFAFGNAHQDGACAARAFSLSL